MFEPSQVPVFILCGGLGTRLREETEIRPKPMVPVGNHPILWHIMRTYSHYGFKNFILCLGYKAEVIKSYFLNYPTMNSDFTIELKTNDIKVHKIDHEQDWTVTLADTGELAMTGARVARAAAKYLGNAQHLAVTYGDGVTDADLAAELEFHLAQGRIGTVLGVNPPSRFGELKLDHDEVVEFRRKAGICRELDQRRLFLLQARHSALPQCGRRMRAGTRAADEACARSASYRSASTAASGMPWILSAIANT